MEATIINNANTARRLAAEAVGAASILTDQFSTAASKGKIDNVALAGFLELFMQMGRARLHMEIAKAMTAGLLEGQPVTPAFTVSAAKAIIEMRKQLLSEAVAILETV